MANREKNLKVGDRVSRMLRRRGGDENDGNGCEEKKNCCLFD